MEATWFSNLQKEIEEIDLESIREPRSDPSLSEHVVGEMSESSRRLFGLTQRYSRAASELLVQDKLLIEQYCELSGKFQLLADIMWASLRDEFQLWQKSRVGLRKGWLVVWSEG